MTRKASEWSRYYRTTMPSLEALQARFVVHRFARHEHEHYVVGLVRRGVQAYRYRGERMVTPADHVFLVNAEAPHTGEAVTPKGYELYALYPQPALLAQLASDLSSGVTQPFFKASVLTDAVLARRLYAFHMALSRGASSMECEAHAVHALSYLLAGYAATGASGKDPLRHGGAIGKACEFIKEHYASDISLSDVATVVGLSTYHFARAFTREIGLPPHAYLENTRIRKARSLLERGEQLASVALGVGYADQSHFTRRFKRFVGVTPGVYARPLAARFDKPPTDNHSIV